MEILRQQQRTARCAAAIDAGDPIAQPPRQPPASRATAARDRTRQPPHRPPSDDAMGHRPHTRSKGADLHMYVSGARVRGRVGRRLAAPY